MRIDIDGLTERELVELNRRIVERLKFLESMHAHSEMLRFSIGDKVSFRPAGRVPQFGVLVKYNRKTVTVVTEDGQRWNVSPQLLSRVKEAGGRPSAKVIDIEERR